MNQRQKSFGAKLARLMSDRNQRTWLLWTVFGLAIVFMGFLAYRILQGEFNAGPCTPGGFPMRCYQVQPSMCETVWSQSDTSCSGIIRGLNLAPGRLLGPIMQKCQMVRLERAFSYNRISTPECDELQKDLESWTRENPDFR